MSPLVLWNGSSWQPAGLPVAPPAGTAPKITTATLPAAVQGVPYSQSLAYTGSAPTSVAVVLGALSTGLSLGLSGGIITVSGIPTASGLFSATVRATNPYGSGDTIVSGTVTAAGSLLPATSLSASNTGYQTSMGALTARSGFTITTPGTVVDRVNVTDGTPITVDAPNCTIKRSKIKAGYWGIEATPNADGLVVEDVTVTGGLNCSIMDDGGADNITYRRVDISGGYDGMKLSGNGRTLQNVYIHDLFRDVEGDSHNDGIQCYDGSNWLFDACRIESPDTSCIAMFKGQGTWSNVTVRKSLLTGIDAAPGPAYALYMPGIGINFKVLDNIFGKWAYGPVTDWLPGGTGWEWSGNTRLGTGAVVNP